MTPNTKRRVLIARAPVSIGPFEVRPGETFTTTEAHEERLVADRTVEIYADQAKVVEHVDELRRGAKSC